MSVTLGSPPGGFNSFLIHCPISKQYLFQLHWDLHPEGLTVFWSFLTVFVSVTLGSPPGGFNSFLIHCPISKQYLFQLHWDLHPEGLTDLQSSHMIPPLSGPVDFHPDLVSITLISDLEPGHVCCDKFSQCKPNAARSKPPDPLNQCCAECWIWLLSTLRCRGHHTYPSKPAFVGNVDCEGCRGDLLCFKAGAAFPWAKCSRTAECPCQG